MKIDEETKNEIRKYLKDSGVDKLVESGYVFDFGILNSFVEECGVKLTTAKTTNYME